jgi:hypothetical protein
MIDGSGAAERPLPVRLALDARAGLVAGDHLAAAHGGGDLLRCRAERLAQPRGPDWMPITPKTGSLFHADSHTMRYAHVAPSTLRSAIDMLSPKRALNIDCKFAGNTDPLRGDIASNSDPP